MVLSSSIYTERKRADLKDYARSAPLFREPAGDLALPEGIASRIWGQT
jgi:hypothetical protein